MLAMGQANPLLEVIGLQPFSLVVRHSRAKKFNNTTEVFQSRSSAPYKNSVNEPLYQKIPRLCRWGAAVSFTRALAPVGVHRTPGLNPPIQAQEALLTTLRTHP